MKYRWTLLSLTAVAAATVAFVGNAAGDEDRYEHETHERRPSWWGMEPGVAAVNNENYRQECGSCHTAYPPGLLPARSWERLMAGLDHHFGDNAELMPEQHETIRRYLVENSADGAAFRTSAKIGRTVAATEAPLRITRTPYFVAKHDEIPARLVEKNPEVGTFSHCSACHEGAEKGYFNEHDVRIPGYGRFDD